MKAGLEDVKATESDAPQKHWGYNGAAESS
jgi:hypothetical protein